MLRKENYKNLDKWRNTKRRQKSRYYGKTQKSKNRGEPWTVEDIKIIMDHELTDNEISALIGRSVGAIQVMRSKMKKKQNK